MLLNFYTNAIILIVYFYSIFFKDRRYLIKFLMDFHKITWFVDRIAVNLLISAINTRPEEEEFLV